MNEKNQNMDKSKKELESVVNSQKEQLNRYDARLKDVVAAYKGLLKEKQALESSLSALTNGKKTEKSIESTAPTSTENATTTVVNKNSDIQTQTLMNSLATLSAEKSRMEQSFQNDKKKLRSEINKKDELIKNLQEKIKDLDKQNSTNLETMKSKIIVEKHEREKETNNHMVMIRELQKLFSDERHLKENLEMQLNDLKQQISSSSSNLSSSGKIKDLTAENRDLKDKLKKYDTGDYSTVDTTTILQQLQTEMANLKKQHSIAIRTEQKRAHFAEERNKKLAALHEERVQNLEARLAELSNTVGNYDRLRQQDQENIHNLKDKLQKISTETEKIVEVPKQEQKKDVHAICDEIIQLKKIVLLENANSGNLIDLSKIFGQNENFESEDYLKLCEELEEVKLSAQKYENIVEEQKRSIKILQEKVQNLNLNIEEQEHELKEHSEILQKALKMEQSKFKSELSALENEYRYKINNLEQQLQKQRTRSLQLLEEKENEIKALKTSFEIFSPQLYERSCSFDESHSRKSSTSHLQSVLNPNHNSSDRMNGTENCHIIHYANEIARKDVEISNLRKSKYSAESSLRQALQDKINTQEELHEKINNLQEEVDRLERCKTREGANLEYLKNVFISFLSTSSLGGKRHMINAIGTVLQFSPAEMKAINSIIFKK